MTPKFVTLAVEGKLDEVVAKRILDDFNVRIDSVNGGQGKGFLQKKIQAFNSAARHHRWIVLVDLDSDEPCAPALKAKWLPQNAPGMMFRIAVHEVESWLLADYERLCGFLKVRDRRIRTSPDEIIDPKKCIVDLANRSRDRRIREEMVPRPESGRKEGPAYLSRLTEFVQNAWCPSDAMRRSDSLKRFINAVERI